MWKLGDIASGLAELVDRASYARALKDQSAVESSWELVERELLFNLPKEEFLRKAEELLTRWEFLDELQDMLGIPESERTFHRRPEKVLLSMLYRAVKRMLAPDYKELDILNRLKTHYLNAYWKITEKVKAQQRLFDAYRHNGWSIPRKELWKMKIYRKARRRIWKRYEILKNRYEEKKKEVSRKLKEAYEFLPTYLELLTSTPADWKVINKAQALSEGLF